MRAERALPRMDVAVAHGVRDAVDAFPERKRAAPHDPPHAVELFPDPRAIGFALELPHDLPLFLPVMPQK